MSLRSFFRSLVVLTGSAIAVGGATQLTAADADAPQYYELRVYTTKNKAQQELINSYWEKAAVPAYNRLGISPIGVFTEEEDSPTSKIYVLIPYDSPGEYATVPAKLADDAAYQKAGADYLHAPKSAPAYERFESSLLVAFDSAKHLMVPPSAKDKSEWIFELRTYQSRSEGTGINKVKMFNAGEVPLMKEVDLHPVFFGQTIVGTGMPNLVYMVSGKNRDEHKVHWKGFFDAPSWKTLLADPQYKDNVSHVDSVFLKRTSASQI